MNAFPDASTDALQNADGMARHPMPLPIKLLLGAGAAGVACTLLWALFKPAPASDDSGQPPPWHTAWMQQQEALQAEREALSTLAQQLGGLQTQVHEGLARIDALQTGHAVLKQDVSTMQQAMAQMQGGFSEAAEQVKALMQQMAALDGRVSLLADAAAKPPAAPAAVRAKAAGSGRTAALRTLLPPFRVLDVEYRGGERFLSVAPKDSRSLSDIRLLREGDSLAGWQLASLSAQQAVFAVGARQQAVSLRSARRVN